jgi:fatty acid desaturase
MLSPAEDPADLRLPATEWPTVGLAFVIYGGWAAVTYWHAALPWWVLIPVAAWLIAWQGSLQHETIHGHPTRHRRINAAIGAVPLSLWLPYERYRQTHLTHHNDERLTDPLDDPESRYWTADGWRELGPLGQRLVRFQGTLVGRLLIGPLWSIGWFWREEAMAVLAGTPGRRALWLRHAAGCSVVLLWLIVICGMPLWLYLTAFVYAGTSLSLLRSFAEHRAATEVARRTAIVENEPVFGLLFLHNNLHVVHHRWPTLPWYQLPRVYRAHRADILATSGGPLYRGYGDVARRFLLNTHDHPLHPLRNAIEPETRRVIAAGPPPGSVDPPSAQPITAPLAVPASAPAPDTGASAGP